MAYLARRIALGVLTLWLVSLFAFLLLRVAPGDAVSASISASSGEGSISAVDRDKLRGELGLDRTWPAQYADWLSGMVRLDPGRSLATGRPVVDELGPRLAVTGEMAFFAIVFMVAVGFGGGVFTAQLGHSMPSAVVRSVAFLAMSVPAFWVSLILIVGVSAWTGHFLALGYEPVSSSISSNLAAIAPAAVVLALRPAAILLRVVRASTLEAAGSHFFLVSRARGLTMRAALVKHAFRVAMLPSMTVIGGQVIFMLGGSVVIEQVFNLPGLGRLLVDAVLARDYPVVEALVLLFGAIAVVVNLLIDASYLLLDPRLRVRN